jgi:hypothetical protein
MTDNVAREGVLALGESIKQLSHNLVASVRRTEALYMISMMVFADVATLAGDPLRYCESLRKRTLDALPPPGTNPDQDSLREEVERLIAKLEASRPMG